ncbi:MAG: hypothetical protein ACOYL5_20240 [Phototrophicaceae bacterium]|jgi:hypothetical protein
MPVNSVTLAYSPVDEAAALALAQALQNRGVTFGALQADGVLLALTSPAALQDADWRKLTQTALEKNIPIVLAELNPTTLPAHLTAMTRIPAGSVEGVFNALSSAQSGVSATPRSGFNRRWGIGIGLFLVIWLGISMWAIVAYDIEAPTADFIRLYTRDAATIQVMVQQFVPQSTEQALHFETTLESINYELATAVVQTATQISRDGYYTPIVTGEVIGQAPMSVVRQTATGGAIVRASATAQGLDSEQAIIAATATQAAITANEELQNQLLTVTAANQ